jgi:multicomponent Na+:H+ antiporter subunit C
MRMLFFCAAGWLLLVGCYGLVRSTNLIHTVISLVVCQSGTYLLLLGVGYRAHATSPVFTDVPPKSPVVDPVVQAMTLTDIVVSATIIALLLALALQVHKREGTLDPDQLQGLRG